MPDVTLAQTSDRKLLGKVPPDAVRRIEIPRLPREVIEGFASLADLTGTVSDSMDSLGLAGTIPAAILPPVSPGKRMVGQAVTVRNVELQRSDYLAAREGLNLMGEQEAYNLAEPGDVVVIEGVPGVSNMGGQSATLAHRQGCAGAVIDGSYRDPDASRELGFPIWARGVTPMTGKWRLETVEINGRVRIVGFSVNAGDLVVADDAGIVFVPFAEAEAVLQEAQRIDDADARRKRDIDDNVDLHALAARKYK